MEYIQNSKEAIRTSRAGDRCFSKAETMGKKKEIPPGNLFVCAVWKEKEESEVVWRALKSVIAKARKLSREKVIVATGYH